MYVGQFGFPTCFNSLCQHLQKYEKKIVQTFTSDPRLETVQDFFIKLDIKPLMHLLEISIFSQNNDLVRLTKIMNNLVKDLKILSYKVIFQCLKLVKSFKKIFCEEYLVRRRTYVNEIF